MNKIININKVLKQLEIGSKNSKYAVYPWTVEDAFNQAIQIIKDNIIKCDEIVDNIEPFTTEEIKFLKHFIKVNKEKLEYGMALDKSKSIYKDILSNE